jgi:lipid-A-disaccharide synthase
MKYFLVAGEASGDLHASNLMREIQRLDSQAQFRFFGGDCMAQVAGVPIKHYREMAYMGVVDVLLHAKTILKNMDLCKREIAQWKPDALILVDYASFNLKIAEFVKKQLPNIQVHFYISPKIWAWKEYRIHAFRKYIDFMYVILPFEIEFFAKHQFPVEYVGNPSVDSVSTFIAFHPDIAAVRESLDLDDRPILALLPGSRTGEIRRNLPLMLQVAAEYPAYQVVLAGAPGKDAAEYAPYLNAQTKLLFGETYKLLHVSDAALVTSGTATLETALFDVPQVVCYAVPGGPFPNWIFKILMHVPYFSLVNLIADKPVVPELLGRKFTLEQVLEALKPLLTDSPERRMQKQGYEIVRARLGQPGAAVKAAQSMFDKIKASTHV